MLREICHFLAINVVKSAFDQMKEGLQTLHILELVKKLAVNVTSINCVTDKPLLDTDMSDLFALLIDELGSNKYPHGELILMHWQD